MNTLTVEGWCRKSDAQPPMPLERIRFHISDRCHLQLEAAEEELRRTHEPEKFVDVDMRELALQTPAECGPLAHCQLRVYLGGMDNSRGQFHLVGHRASDDSLVYTNAVMVDQLG
jgi:hypothetical protein